MEYTYLHNVITNMDKAIRYAPTSDKAENFYSGNTKPKLGYLLLARDVITDAFTQEMSAIRIFDTLYILKGQETLTYSMCVLGRVYLSGVGTDIIPTVLVKLKISDPTGVEIHTEDLTGIDINPKYGMNINARLWLLQFKLVGKYKIDTSISINSKDFIDVDSPLYFSVEKQT